MPANTSDNATPNHHALIVGVDKYPNLDKKYELSGCVNDAKLIQRVLVDQFNFKPENIVSLHDAAATRDAILGQMTALTQRIDQDDIVVFHFSGHGSRRRSSDPAEATGKDSTIMPTDSGRRPQPNLDISDKEINDWLESLTAKTRNVTLTFDCCHSGTITRDAFGATPRSVEDDDRTLEELGLAPMSVATRGSGSPAGRGGFLALSESYVVMSGCRDDELSHEFREKRGDEIVNNGALTHYLVDAIMRSRPGTTYRDVFETARTRVSARFPSQHPQIEGTQDREVFGVRDIAPLRFVAVAAVNGDHVTLAGGAAHGLHPGSTWRVFPPGAKTVDEPFDAVLHIDRVGALSSDATVIERSGELRVDGRAVEHAASGEQFRLPVITPEHAELKSAVAESTLLRDVADGADLRIYALAPRGVAAADDPVPQLTSIAEPVFAVVNSEGALAMPPVPQSEAGAIKRVVGNLEVMSRYRNALALDNPNSRLDVAFNIYRDVDGEWELANGGDTLFTVGDSLCFEVINREAFPVFFSIVDFGLTGRIKLLFPSNKTSEMLGAGRTVRLGSGSKRLRLSVPDDLVGDRGTETLKAFITRDEADFRWLEQQGTRSLGARSRLDALFQAAYHGPTTRDLGFDDEDEADTASDDWRAIARSFDLQRKHSN